MAGLPLFRLLYSKKGDRGLDFALPRISYRKKQRGAERERQRGEEGKRDKTGK